MKWVIFQADLRNNARTVWPTTTKFGRITLWGRRVGSTTSLPQGGGAQALPCICCSLLFMCTPFDAELPNLTWQHICREGTCFQVTHVGRGVYLEVSHATPPIPRQRSSKAPHFLGPHYLCTDLLTQNIQIRHGNTYGEGRVLEVSHAITFAQMRRAVCQRQLSFLWSVIGTCDTWTTACEEYNANGQGAKVRGANSVEACKRACINNASCTAADFFSDQPPDSRCFLVGHWSGEKGKLAHAQHHVINRNCLSSTGQNVEIRCNIY